MVAVLVLGGCATGQPLSGRRSIEGWIARLHDREEANRNAAIYALARESDTALPLLRRELKRETDPNRRWWLKAAIQQCEEELPRPGQISVTPDQSRGLQVNEACTAGDGPFTVVEYHGVRCWKTPQHESNAWSYLYFKADDAFREKAWSALEIQLEYLDAGKGDIGLDYDSSDPRAPVHGAYENHSLTVHRINSGQWRTVQFRIRDARFRGSQNGGSDVRFSCLGDSLLVGFVRVWPVPSDR